MNEKLSIQDLITLFAERQGMNKKDADWFVKEFFQLIEQGLENDQYVKIKGLGTFKLIGVDSRESVNINTGERIQIQGHSKISFVPDAALRDIVNKPFSHFETVVLNENTILEDTLIDSSEDDTEEPVETETVSQSPEEPTLEEEEVITEDTATAEEDVTEAAATAEEVVTEATATAEEGMTEATATAEEDVTEATATATVKAEEDMPTVAVIAKTVEATVVQLELQPETNISAKEQEDVVDSAIEHSKTLVEESDIPAENLPIATEEPIADVSIIEPKASVEDIIAKEIKKVNVRPTAVGAKARKPSPHAVPKKTKDQKSPVLFLVVTIFVILLLCGGAIFYIYNPDILSSFGNQEVAKEENIQPVMKKDIPLADTINKNTINKDTVAEVVPNVKREVLTQPVKKAPESAKVQPRVEPAKNEPAKVAKVQPRVEPVKVAKVEPVKKKESKPAMKSGVPVKPDSVNYEIKGTKATHTVKEGETLTRVSLQFYGTKNLWPYIVKHNKAVIKNPDNVPYGTVIKIPELVKK